MGINFPNSPTNGALYTPPGGYQYVYLDGVWRVVESPQSVGTAQARNRIVNGAMQISQENGTTSGATQAWYAADQWMSAFSGMGATAFGLEATSPYNQLALASVKASLAAGDYAMMTQNMEGARTKDFEWGSATAIPAVLRFEAYCTAGTYSVAIRNAAVDRTFLASFTVPANTWTPISIPIPGDTAGTWPTSTAMGMSISFVFACGSTFLGAAGWQAGNKLGVTGMTNGFAASSTQRIRKVGLYLDPNATGVPPPWQMPDEAQELAACQRYYSKFTLSGVGLNFNGYAAGVYMKFLFPTQMNMRTLPALAMVIPGMTLGGSAQNVGAALTLNNLGWLFSVSGATSNANVSFVAGDYYAVNARM